MSKIILILLSIGVISCGTEMPSKGDLISVESSSPTQNFLTFYKCSAYGTVVDIDDCYVYCIYKVKFLCNGSTSIVNVKSRDINKVIK